MQYVISYLVLYIGSQPRRWCTSCRHKGEGHMDR